MNKNNYKIPLKHQLVSNVTLTEHNQMPIVQAYRGEIPQSIESFNRLRNSRHTEKTVHFYIQDAFFECVWNRPYIYLGMLGKFHSVISTDYSLYSDMARPEVEWNSFRNKLLCAWWQKRGIDVIPNVSWWRDCSEYFLLEGFPKKSIISINSTGIGVDAQAKKQWIKGYERVIEVLQPTHIVRYGAQQEGERTDISTYYKNDNYKNVYYGR